MARVLGETAQQSLQVLQAALAEIGEQLLEIVNYLDSANTSHLRYKPKSRTTYCNIYAYDYCYLAGVFLPRTWWTGPALRRMRDGESLWAQLDFAGYLREQATDPAYSLREHLRRRNAAIET